MSASPAARPSEPVANAAPASPSPKSKVVEEGVAEDRRQSGLTAALASKTWQLATLIMPIVLTTWLTFWVSQKENNIKQDIDKQSQLFSQQLQLSEELYKRRFDAYEKLYAQLVQLNARLQTQGGAEAGDWSKINADRVVQFNESLELSKLHMSRKVENLTFEAWLAGARADGPLLSQRIGELEVAMKAELDNWMLEEKGARAPETISGKPKKSKLQPRSPE